MAIALFTLGGTISMAGPAGGAGVLARLRGADLAAAVPSLADLDVEVEIYDVIDLLWAHPEVDTDLGNVVAHGSDGSQVRQKLHAHFKINANGEVSVEFSRETASC